MPDKLVSIRMNENLAEILEERATSLNKLAPEIKVTMGGSVRHAAETYALELARQEIERRLVCPLPTTNLGKSFKDKFNNNPFVTDNDNISFSTKELENLASSFQTIAQIFKNNNKISSNIVEVWESIGGYLKNEANHLSSIEESMQQDREYDDNNS